MDFGGNEIRNVLLQSLSSDPTALGNAHIYYNSSTHKVRVRADGAWMDLGEGGATSWTTLDDRPAHLTGTPNAANQVLVLDGDALIPVANIPAIAITEYLGEVANQSAMLALDGQMGDWCIREDLGKVFVITGDDPTDIEDWTALEYPVPDDPDWTDIQNKPSTFPPRKLSQTIGNGSSTQITVTHNFGTRDVVVSVRENSGNHAEVICDVERTSDDAVRLSFAGAPASNALRVVVIG